MVALAHQAEVINGVIQMVQAVDLPPLGTAPPDVVKRKAPKFEPGVDQPTQITISPGVDKEDYKPLAMSGAVRLAYPVDITIEAPNDDDYLSNFDLYSFWREEIRDAFRPPWLSTPIVPGASTVYDILIDPGVFLERDQVKNLADYFTIRVWCISAE